MRRDLARCVELFCGQHRRRGATETLHRRSSRRVALLAPPLEQEHARAVVGCGSVSPYRQNARPPPLVDVDRPWLPLRALLSAIAFAALGLIVWERAPSRSVALMPVKRQHLPAHAPLTSVCADWTGTRAFAVGRRGEVFVRSGEGADGWRRMPRVVDADLNVVAMGDGPVAGTVFGPHWTTRVFAAGSRGTLVGCSASSCTPIATGATHDLRAIAIAGGQALVVGDGGTILHLVPDAQGWLARRDGDLVAVERVFAGVTDDLDSVSLECDDTRGPSMCAALATGPSGVVVEGEGRGVCDNGRRFSGSHTDCIWTWRASHAAGARFGRTTRDLEAPVHVVTTKLWRKQEARTITRITLPPLRAEVDGKWSELHAERHIVSAASTRGGGALLAVDSDGDLYLAE